MDRRGREGCTADNPVAGCREGKGRQDGAAQQRRSATGSGREGKKVGASKVDKHAAQCRAGLRESKKVVRAGIVDTVSKGKERDKRGSREGDTGRQDPNEQAARGTISRANGQRAGEGGWPWVHGLTGVPREEIALVGRCSPPTIPPVIPPFLPPPYPAMGMVYPAPSAYPGVPSQAHAQQKTACGNS